VFDRVKAGNAREACVREHSQLGGVILNERQPLDFKRFRANIDYGDRGEAKYVRDEAVDPRADVYVRRRVSTMDFASGPEILVKVMLIQFSSTFAIFSKAWA
jgi:hypothetical protein